MHPSLRLTVSALVLGMGTAASVAHADPASDAKDLFSRGRDTRAKGDCAGAVGLFRRAYETYPAGLGSLRNVAECEEQLGHFASSRRAWLDLKRGLIVAGDDHKYDGWSQDADQAAARLAPKLATVTVDLNLVGPDGAATTGGKGVDVTMDGEPLAAALVGTPLERDPGRHVVRVGGARVHDPQQKALDLVAGDVKRVAMRVVVAPDKVDANDAAVGAPVPGPTQPGTEPPIEDGGANARATRRMIGWIAIGAGGASLVGAGISLAVRQSALNEVNGVCHGTNNCPDTERATVSRGDLAATLVNVLGAIGLVGVAGGIVLLSTSSDPATSHAGLVVTPTLGGASAAWSW